MFAEMGIDDVYKGAGTNEKIMVMEKIFKVRHNVDPKVEKDFSKDVK